MFKIRKIIASCLLFVPLILQASDTLQQSEQLAQTCAACHGSKGNSTVSQWPKLAGQHPKYLEKQLIAFKEHQRQNAAMAPMVEPLSDEDIQALASYFSQQTITIGFAKKERLEEGKTLYRAGNKERGISACIACHGPKGLGNNQANFPKLSGQNVEYTITQLNDYKSGKRATDPNEIMRDIARRMTEQDIKDVANYITGLH